MNKMTSFKSFAELQNVELNKIAAPKVPKAPKAQKAQKAPVVATVPSWEETSGMLVAIVDGAFPELFEASTLADFVVQQIASEEKRRDPTCSVDTSIGRAMDGIVQQFGVSRSGVHIGTRMSRLLKVLSEDLPATSTEGELLRQSSTGSIITAINPRQAMRSMQYYAIRHPGQLPGQYMDELEIAKTTREESLRHDWLRHLRATRPDFGVALLAVVLAGMQSPGEIRKMAPTTRQWGIAMLSDLRSVLGNADPLERAILLMAHCDEDVEIDELRNMAKAVLDYDGMAKGRRQVYDDADQHAKWLRLQGEFDVLQQEAINIVDRILLTFRDLTPSSARAVKADAPKVVAPAPRVKSVDTPIEAIQKLAQTTDIETEMSLPSVKGEVMEMALPALRKNFVNANVDGARECAIYPGVVWECVMGPVYHALDVTCEDRNDATVVIAPRRVGGMGIDLAEVRILMLGEYEEYFTPLSD